MRRAGLLVGETLQLLRETIKPGMTTSALDALAAAGRVEDAREWFRKCADLDEDQVTDAAERAPA